MRKKENSESSINAAVCTKYIPQQERDSIYIFEKTQDKGKKSMLSRITKKAITGKENVKTDEKNISFSQTFMKKRDQKNPKKLRRSARDKKNKGTCKDDDITLPVFCNRITISIEGFNQNRLISALLKEGVNLYSVKKISQKLMKIVVAYKFKQKAIAIIQKMCYNYSIVGVSGINPISRWMLARIGLLIGALVFTVVAAISHSYIWKIDISGNDKVDSLTIMRELADTGVSVGKSKRFDCFSVSQEINGLDGIVECTIEIVGTTVKVSVIEAKDYIRPNNDETIGDIVSLYDAEVTRVIVSGGTGKVRIGDRVPKGDILIGKEVLNTNGETIAQTKAKGSVYGKVFFSESVIISTTTEVTVRTGNKKRVTSLALYGANIGAKNKHDFLYYQSVVTSSYAFKNTFVPIKVNQTTYYEVKKQLVERPIEELIDEYKRAKLLSTIISAGGSEIKTTLTKQELSPGLYNVHFYMEAEMLIGQFVASPPVSAEGE